MSDYEPLYQIPYDLSLVQAYSDATVYYDAVWLTTHNAFSNQEDGWAYAQQSMNLEHMFLHGVRSFMIDIYEHNSNLYLCHGGCGAPMIFQKTNHQPDTLEKLLLNIHKLLNENLQDIITLHIESYASGKDVLQAIEKSGLLDNLLKGKNPNDDSLTLGWMRKNDERLVVFSDYAYERKLNDNSVYNKMGRYKGIFPTLNYKETQYSLDDYRGCEMRLDFRAQPNDPNTHLFVFNHFSPFSALKDYNIINKYTSIMKRVELCLSSQLHPNFIAVDYFEQGECSNCVSSKQVVLTLNTIERALKTHNLNQILVAPQNLPAYSHIYDIGGYIFSSNMINCLIYSAIDYLIYKGDHSVNDAIEGMHGKGSAKLKNMLHVNLDGLYRGAHVLTESAMLYNAYNTINDYHFNKIICATSTTFLAYNAPYIYNIPNDNNIFRYVVDYRGWIVFPVYTLYLAHQILPSILPYYKETTEC